MIADIVSQLQHAQVYDLAQPYYVGMPHHPSHPPYLFSLVKKHGDFVSPVCGSSASESIALGGHVGTHVDALCHFSKDGYLHDGSVAADVQSYDKGLARLSVDGMRPLLGRGVLLDVAGLMGVDELPEDFVITPEHLEACEKKAGVKVPPNGIACIRTGWARYWGDAPKYIRTPAGPGPELDGAVWLSSRGVMAAGSDTVAFERVPNPEMPVHLHLLVENGIHIIEALNLEQLAYDRVYDFLFLAAPLKITGGTGSPIRPLALKF